MLPFGLQVSATMQSSPGPQITASYTVRSNQVQGLGRSLSNGTAAIALIEPGTMYGARYNQVDARVTKIVPMGRSRLRLMVDSYNLLNASTALSLNNTFGPQWQRPTSILPGRFAKVGIQVDF
jgi:hypothetical protein